MIRPLRRRYVAVVRKTDELLCVGYKWCRELRRRAFALDGRVSAEWNRCPGSSFADRSDFVAVVDTSYLK